MTRGTFPNDSMIYHPQIITHLATEKAEQKILLLLIGDDINMKITIFRLVLMKL
jgi:hypothetical protein